MIRLRGLTLSLGGRELLRDADASLAQGERVALIGANGSGKTSLLSALAGDGLVDAGEIDQPYRRVTRLEQSVPHSERPAWEFLVEGDGALAEAQRALDEAKSVSAGEQSSGAQAVSDEAGLQWARAHAAWLEAGALTQPRGRTLCSQDSVSASMTRLLRSAIFLADGGCASISREHCLRQVICYSSTSLRITWISMPCSGWNAG